MPVLQPRRLGTRRAFSLVELVIVVTILGVLASIAVPRMSRASADSKATALKATLANVRKAIDVYYAEHGKYPGYDFATGLPLNKAFVDQLLMYTDENGKTSSSPSAVFRYGPYLRNPFPRNPSNELDTVYVMATPDDAEPAEGAFGWVAVLSHGYFGICATDDALDEIGFTNQATKALARGLPSAAGL